ncbi:Protein CBG14502 [Caenorhabditis briggsae]|uniref:Protein CBG14502 n=1 Tax=Caenorhabditis briggsae TaxID=6238 RepID=A8XK28_CAEBR|nr:Protein CBG14502 [Caenorhabditis briggsae]CAP33004.2 Protein CBG14502 [Caenorhabditis briggsae]
MFNSRNLHSMNPNVRQVKETAKRQLNVKIGINDLTILHLDDYIREALLDPIYGFSTSKWFLRKNRLPNNCKEEIKKLIKTHIFEEGGSVIRKAICTILSLYEDDERLSVLVENYMQLFYAKSGFTAAPCHQFSTEQHVGLKLIATKKWEKDEILNSHNFNVLFDTIPLELNEYSVSKPSVGQKEHIWLGPSSIVNHSCEPNTVYEHYEKKTLLKVIRPIEIGEEITVNYSKKYFFKCECDTCKLSQEDSDKELAKTYALYKKLFDSVDYPPELKESAGSAEHSFTQRFLMIETPQIDQHLRTFAKQTKDMVHRVQVSRNLLSKDEVNENLTRNCWKNAEKLIQIGTVFMTGPEKLEANDVDDLKSMAKFIEVSSSIMNL